MLFRVVDVDKEYCDDWLFPVFDSFSLACLFLRLLACFPHSKFGKACAVDCAYENGRLDHLYSSGKTSMNSTLELDMKRQFLQPRETVLIYAMQSYNIFEKRSLEDCCATSIYLDSNVLFGWKRPVHVLS